MTTFHDTNLGPDVRSDDGRTFVALTDHLHPGDLAVIDAGSTSLLSQVRARAGDPTTATGLILGHLADGRLERPQGRASLGDATIRPAGPAEAGGLQAASRATMEVGTWQLGVAEAPLRLRPAGFARHTFVCGQSGSGKTFALGVVLEQLILDTRLRLFVIDPNADFVHLGTTRPDAPPGAVDRFAAAGTLDVQRADGAGGEALRVRFGHLSVAAQASVMQLNPVRDRGEFNEWLHIDMNDTSLDRRLAVRAGLRPARREPRHRRLEDLAAQHPWSGADARAVRSHNGPRHLGFRPSRRAARRRPRPPRPSLGRAGAAATRPHRHRRGPQHLSVRPVEPVGTRRHRPAHPDRRRGSQVHPQVVSQCDNLMLMRMNSPSDVADLSRLFGFAPEAMLAMSPNFYQGEALFAGAFVPVPSFGRMGARLTIEGGIDVPVPLP